MGFYQKYILPAVIEWACSSETSREQREKVVPLAAGNVLEIGIGSGRSLSLYDASKVKHLTALDPRDKLWKRRKADTGTLDFEVTYIRGVADRIPAEDGRFDTVVTTYTLCSIKKLENALKEIYRVLKPGGKLIFSEHGKAPDRGLERLQNLINPFWRQIGGGCNLNRDIPMLLKRNGFQADGVTAGYLSGFKLTSYHYWGIALRI